MIFICAFSSFTRPLATQLTSHRSGALPPLICAASSLTSRSQAAAESWKAFRRSRLPPPPAEASNDKRLRMEDTVAV